MKPAFTDVGIVLRSVDFFEADRLVGILSHYHGYQEYLAKGARRLNSKKAPHLDLLNQVKFQIGRGNSPQMLIQAEAINYFPEIKKSLEKTRFSLTVSEVITNLVAPEEEDKEMYLSLSNFFISLNLAGSPDEVASLVSRFGQYIIKHLGYPPPNTFTTPDLTTYFETLISKRLISRQLK